MVDVGELSGESWPEPQAKPITPEEVRVAAEEVASCFMAVAATLHWAGELADTARAMIELGPKLSAFGELYGRHAEQTFNHLNRR